MDSVLQELQTIKILLIVIAAFAGLGTLIFLFIAVNLVDAIKEKRSAELRRNREAEIEDLLDSGKGTAARFAATEWLNDQPKSTEAHWALARAHYQLGELATAKEVLENLLKVAPDQRYRVDDWLEHVEQEFRSRRPKPV